jgi:MoaA/NifB/PqqE/SkfB family radical SAM enzyme
MWKHTKEDERLSIEDYTDFMSSLREFAGDRAQIQFVGGEPMMKKGIIELIHHAAQLGLKTTMTTNGFLIEDGILGKIIDSGLNTLGFSLESLAEYKHDYLRGVNGVYRRIMDTIGHLERSPDTSLQLFISSIIMGVNLDDLGALAEWVNANSRLNFIYFQAVMQPFAMPESDTWYNDEQCRLLWPDTDRACAVLDELIRLKKIGYKINNRSGQLEAFKSYFKNPQQFIKRAKCNLGYQSFTVLPDGNIFLCLSMQPIGNIKTDSLDEVWFSNKADMVRDQIAHCQNNCKLMINCFFEEEK